MLPILILLFAGVTILPSKSAGITLSDCISGFTDANRYVSCNVRNDTKEHIRVILIRVCAECKEEYLTVDVLPGKTAPGHAWVNAQSDRLTVEVVRVQSVQD